MTVLQHDFSKSLFTIGFLWIYIDNKNYKMDHLESVLLRTDAILFFEMSENARKLVNGGVYGKIPRNKPILKFNFL